LSPRPLLASSSLSFPASCHFSALIRGREPAEAQHDRQQEEALKKALATIRHLRGDRVFFQRDGSAVDETTLRSWTERAQRQAGLAVNKGQIHILRHTFCSHLAMRGVPAKVIQELAGHADLTTTMRYIHLAKGSKEAAIAVLDQPPEKRGDLPETRSPG
jgi:site-specific recombinase XerC